MNTKTIGYTVQKKPIFCWSWKTQDSSSLPYILILGGVHGDEVEGVTGAFGLYDEFSKNYSLGLNLDIIPCLNWDGLFLRTRQNANGIDLNRNLPSQDWSATFEKVKYYPGKSPSSEPENQALMQLLKSHSYSFIMTLHSWHPLLNTNGDCHPIVTVLHEHTGYKIKPDIGYPTPGSLGSYGLEHHIPVLTYEFEKGMDPSEIICKHIPAIKMALKAYEEQI